MNATSPDWFAVYTKPRQEHVALRNLEGQAFECFLPLLAFPGDKTDGQKYSKSKPLFPRYLFLNACPQEQNLATVRSTRGVVGLVRAGFELIKIPASIIAALKLRMQDENGLAALNGSDLKGGDKVRVFDGPFAELEGVFKESRGKLRSLLLLDILGRQTVVEIDARKLKRIS